jgi:hypothetical protein
MRPTGRKWLASRINTACLVFSLLSPPLPAFARLGVTAATLLATQNKSPSTQAVCSRYLGSGAFLENANSFPFHTKTQSLAIAERFLI